MQPKKDGTITINGILDNHSELNKPIQKLLKDRLLPFKNIFHEKLK